MSLRLLADENVDQRVVHRLSHFGHDVEHVDFVTELGKGSDDGTIADHSLESERLVPTNDDDFLTEFHVDDFHGLLFIEDETLPAEHVSDIVHATGEHVDSTQVSGVIYVRSTWLRSVIAATTEAGIGGVRDIGGFGLCDVEGNGFTFCYSRVERGDDSRHIRDDRSAPRSLQLVWLSIRRKQRQDRRGCRSLTGSLREVWFPEPERFVGALLLRAFHLCDDGAYGPQYLRDVRPYGRPDDVEVDRRVPVDEFIAHSGHLGPRHVVVLVTDVVRDVLGRLSHHLEVSEHRVDGLLVLDERLERHPVRESDDFLGRLDDVIELRQGIGHT